MLIKKPFQNKDTGPKINKRIESSEVRLVGETGDMVGVVSLDEALDRARNVGLDLVEVSPDAKPPVCKILDYGKYKYEQEKKSKKKAKKVTVKEIKMRPTIEEHDYQTKLKHSHKFLDQGHKVKFVIRFRGRELAYKEQGFELFKRIETDLGEHAKIEVRPKMEGRQMAMVAGPNAKSHS